MELRGTPVSVNNTNTRGDFAGELTIPGCAGTGEVAPPRLTPGKLQSLPGVKASLRCQGSTRASPVQTLCCVALYL